MDKLKLLVKSGQIGMPEVVAARRWQEEREVALYGPQGVRSLIRVDGGGPGDKREAIDRTRKRLRAIHADLGETAYELLIFLLEGNQSFDMIARKLGLDLHRPTAAAKEYAALVLKRLAEHYGLSAPPPGAAVPDRRDKT